MNPKHTDQNIPRHIEKRGVPPYDVYARAPYSFVPLPEQVVTVVSHRELENKTPEEQRTLLDERLPNHNHYQDNTTTGYIECELVTQSPLYVRGLMTQSSFEQWGDKSFSDLPTEEAKQERAKFFMLRDNEPVIPGSSLRGMIRALVEIAGFGKVNPVTDKQILYRAVGDPASLGQYYRGQMLGQSKVPPPNTELDYPSLQLRGGYLRERNGQWSIQPAQKHFGESFIHVDYAEARAINIQQNTQSVHQVLVTPAPRSPSNRGRRNQGDLTLDLAIAPRGGIAVRHRGQTPKPGMVEATLIVSGHMGGQHPKHWHCAIYAPDPAAPFIRIPDERWKSYEEDRDMTRGFPARKLQQDGDPLFYLVDANEQLQFFGPTMMFRLPYPRTAQDFVPERLRRESDVDLAEAIFGYTKSDKLPSGKSRAYASRVFVTNAALVGNQGNVWLTAENEMITPRILSSPKPTTFQHYLVQGNDAAREKKNLKHYASATPDETVIRGHKLYWHKQENLERQDIEADTSQIEKAKSQLTGIKPVRAGVAFKFRVYFENLNDAELGALLWVLGLPEGHSQSLGMGKPLGMGAVKIAPTLYLSQRSERYSKLFANGAWADGVSRDADIKRFRDAFETFMLKTMDVLDKDNAQSFGDVERIKMLLKMLEFPGPDKDWTRYTEIERDKEYPESKVNEFKERPVLPNPLYIKPTDEHAAPSRQFAPRDRQAAPRKRESERVRDVLKQQAQTAPPKRAAPDSPYKVGDKVTGKVYDIWHGEIFIIETRKMPITKGYARVTKADSAGKGWKKGDDASCKVMQVGKDQKGFIVLYCKVATEKTKK